MKILFITDLYPVKPGEATTPVTLHNFVIEWVKQGHDVEVIKSNFIFNSFLRGKPFYKDDFYKFEGVNIFNVNYFSPFCFDITRKIPKEIDVESYDVIIAHMPSGIIFANKLSKKFNKPLVCGVHSSDIEVLTNPFYKIYFKPQMLDAYRNAKKIACRSKALLKKINKMLPDFADKTFVAPSGIKKEDKRCRCVDALQNLHASTPLRPYYSVLTCANLIKRKNIDKLILAMKDLEGFELTIIGEGKELKKLKKIENISNSKINFLGRLTREKVLEEMRKADIFILPSVNETFGMVYLEAMASGCITVCTSNDGIDGIIKDNENGFLCKPDVAGIKKVLLEIKDSKKLDEIRQNSLETIKEYTQESCAKNYLDNLL